MGTLGPDARDSQQFPGSSYIRVHGRVHELTGYGHLGIIILQKTVLVKGPADLKGLEMVNPVEPVYLIEAVLPPLRLRLFMLEACALLRAKSAVIGSPQADLPYTRKGFS